LKLYPGYLLFIAYLLVMPLLKAVLRGGDATGAFAAGFGQLWPNFLFLQNYLGSPAGHTWSLAVEEHFYLTLPFVLVALAARNRVALLLPLCVVMVPVFLSLRCLGILSGSPLAETMTATHFRLDALLFGVGVRALAQFHPAVFQALGRSRGALVAVGAVLWLPVIVLEPDTVFTRTVGLSATFLGSAAFLVAAYHTHAADFVRLQPLVAGAAAIMAWVGVYSYGIYLWHVTVFGIASREIGGRVAAVLGTNAAGWMISAVSVCAAAVLVGAMATRLVEEPVLRLRDRLFPSRSAGLPGMSPAAMSAAPSPEETRVAAYAAAELSNKEAV
jgi:peptidoglycan/LPS O-acetylase OafA/YrhL